MGRLRRKIYKNFSFLNKKLKIIEEIKDKKKFTKYDPNLFNIKTEKNIYLEGYFQTEKYFQNIKDEILNEFIFKDEIQKRKNKFKELILKNNSVLIHINTALNHTRQIMMICNNNKINPSHPPHCHRRN